MTRHLLALGALALLALPLAACGDTSAGTAAPGSGAAPSVSQSPKPTEASVDPSPVTEATTDTPSAITTPPTTAPVTDGSGPAAGALKACAIVDPPLLDADLGTTLTAAGMDEPSTYGDPASMDCAYFQSDGTVVAAEATTRADQDAPASGYDLSSLPGAEKIPGADRGYAYVVSSGSTASVVTIFVVKGQSALNLAVTAPTAVTVDQAVKAGQDILAKLP